MPENFDSVAHLFKQSKTWKIEIKARQRAFVNCGAEEDSWQSLRLQGDQTSQS